MEDLQAVSEMEMLMNVADRHKADYGIYQIKEEKRCALTYLLFY